MKRLRELNKFIKSQPVMPGKALVVGSKIYEGKEDRRKLYKDAFGVDQFEGNGVDLAHDLEYPLPETLGKFNHIDCCSVLEHAKRPWKIAENIEAVMAPGASIILQVPFVWRVHDYPGDYWRMTTESFEILFPNVTWIETGYMMGDGLKKAAERFGIGNNAYFRRAEATGFGCLNT